MARSDILLVLATQVWFIAITTSRVTEGRVGRGVGGETAVKAWRRRMSSSRVAVGGVGGERANERALEEHLAGNDFWMANIADDVHVTMCTSSCAQRRSPPLPSSPSRVVFGVARPLTQLRQLLVFVSRWVLCIAVAVEYALLAGLGGQILVDYLLHCLPLNPLCFLELSFRIRTTLFNTSPHSATLEGREAVDCVDEQTEEEEERLEGLAKSCEGGAAEGESSGS